MRLNTALNFFQVYYNVFCVHLIGMLNLEEFRRVYDLYQHSGKEQSGTLRGQFKQRNKHTWLYQGVGSHHVLQTLRSRYDLVSLSCQTPISTFYTSFS